MYKATRLIYEALKQEDGFKVFTDETPNTTCVWLQFSVENGGSYRIRFINTDDDNDTAVRVFGLIHVNEDARPRVLKACNAVNRKFRYVKFVLDDDGDVNVEYDFPVIGSNPATSAREMVIRFADIVDKAYPDLMRAIYDPTY